MVIIKVDGAASSRLTWFGLLNTLSIIHITFICHSHYLSHHKLNLYALLMCINDLELKRINLECFMNHLME